MCCCALPGYAACAGAVGSHAEACAGLSRGPDRPRRPRAPQVWLAPGSGLANDFVDLLRRLSADSTAVMLAIFAVFAAVHSGLAYLRPAGAPAAPAPRLGCCRHSRVGSPALPCPSRTLAARQAHAMDVRRGHKGCLFPKARAGLALGPHQLKPRRRAAGEGVVGARAFRVLFAAVSLPLATVAVVYFINHRYDGVPLWNLRGAPGVHEAVWVANFVSFFFLYPSTFNLLEARRPAPPALSHTCLLAAAARRRPAHAAHAEPAGRGAPCAPPRAGLPPCCLRAPFLVLPRPRAKGRSPPLWPRCSQHLHSTPFQVSAILTNDKLPLRGGALAGQRPALRMALPPADPRDVQCRAAGGRGG